MRISLIILLLVVYLFPNQSVASYATLFDSKEVRSKNLKPFFKWTDMLVRFQQKHFASNPCIGDKGKCHKEEWMSFLNTLKDKSTTAKINAVNTEMNKADYILDIVNWGVQDYWETPYQFFVKDGDCEDYAIAKYMSLKLLGLDPDKMRIVVLQDTNLGVVHAVLAVNVDGQAMILDNQFDKVISDEKIHHYVPIYSINESSWWRHRR